MLSVRAAAGSTGWCPWTPVGQTLPRCSGRTQQAQYRVCLVPRKYRHSRPTGTGDRCDRRRRRGTGTLLNSRAGARGHAARPDRRSAYRPGSAGTGPCRHPTRPSARAESPPDCSRASHLDGYRAVCAKKAADAGPATPLNASQSMAGPTRSGYVKRWA